MSDEKEQGGLLQAEASRLSKLHQDLETCEAAGSENTEKLDKLDRRLATLKARAGQPVAEPAPAHHGARHPAGRTVVQRDPIVLGDIPAELVERIETETFKLPRVAEPMDTWDWAATVSAGLAGALVDFLLVKIPKSMSYMGGPTQPGSPITQYLREHLGSETDNWLAKYAKAPFDRVTGIPGGKIPGMNPREHRLVTFGHDPLLGLVFGIFDILRGTMTGVDTGGTLFIRPVPGGPEHSWAAAPLVWLAHLLSDVATKQGLPVPGWGLTQLLQFGEGPSGRNIAEISRFMWHKGYDLRHYLVQGASVGTVELIVRGYCALRHGFGDDGEGLDALEVEHAGEYRDVERSHHMAVLNRHFCRARFKQREARMLLLAHTLAAGANAIKVGVYGGNPLAINLAQWQMWVWSLARVAGGWMARQGERELERIMRNRRQIDAGWAELLEPLPGLLAPSEKTRLRLPAFIPATELSAARDQTVPTDTPG